MKRLNELTWNELKTIFEASYRKRDKVIQFGQSIDNPNLMERPELIDTLDLLSDLYDEADKVYDLTAFGMHDLEGTDFEWLEEYEINAINTYNWSAPLTNDLDFRVYKVEKNLFLSVAVQNGWSDIRAGYMIEFLFKFDTSYSSDDWAILLSELPSSNKSFSIDDYSFGFDLFGESGVFNVWHNLAADNEQYDVCIGDYDDCVNWVNERKEELTLND